MADFGATADAIRTAFNSGWTALSNGVVSLPDNLFNADEYPPGTPFPPVDGDGNPTSWIRPLMTPALMDRSTMGGTGGKYLSEGIVVIEIFTPLNRGPGEAEDLCDDAIGILRNMNTNNVRVDDPHPIRVGIVDETYYKYNVEAKWLHFDVAA